MILAFGKSYLDFYVVKKSLYVLMCVEVLNAFHLNVENGDFHELDLRVFSSVFFIFSAFACSALDCLWFTNVSYEILVFKEIIHKLVES